MFIGSWLNVLHRFSNRNIGLFDTDTHCSQASIIDPSVTCVTHTKVNIRVESEQGTKILTRKLFFLAEIRTDGNINCNKAKREVEFVLSTNITKTTLIKGIFGYELNENPFLKMLMV